MIQRTYACDLCHKKADLDKLVPISWRSGLVEGHGWREVLVRASDTNGPSERHLCQECIKDIKNL
jgi:hypothetical protein